MSSIDKRLAECSSYLLGLAGGRLNYTKLIKLLYIADRESLRLHGFPITGDRYVSMNNGPVLSRLYRLIRNGSSSPEWDRVAETDEYDLVSKEAAHPTELSEAETEILREVFRRYQACGYSQMIDIVHTFPEWQFPDGSSVPIEVESILKGAGHENDIAKDLAEELETNRRVAELFG